MHYRCLAHIQIVIYNVSIVKYVSVSQWTEAQQQGQASIKPLIACQTYLFNPPFPVYLRPPSLSLPFIHLPLDLIPRSARPTSVPEQLKLPLLPYINPAILNSQHVHISLNL